MNKDKKWMSGPNDPGILRKKDDETDKELFVFGYSCKIFKDDIKAAEIDRGTHLINWMGNDQVKVDRYDARGHLSELSMYEGSGSYVFTPEEKRIEKLCDEERYRALFNNEEENQLYQEEEFKRLRQALNQDNEYGQVAYKYSETTPEGTPPGPAPEAVEQQEEPFVPNPLVELPFGMTAPETKNQHLIIEKTAFMINSHGPQMEFVVKVKQGTNVKFRFLHAGDRLNPYYNFLREQIKTGKYRSQITSSGEESQASSYLHPSLTTTSHVESAPIITTIPSIAYKPSDDCAYNQLVNKIKTMQKVHEFVEPKKLAPAVKKNKTPPPEVVEVISRLLKFAKENNLDPSLLASRIASKNNMDFLNPLNEYHVYYCERLQQYQEQEPASLAVDLNASDTSETSVGVNQGTNKSNDVDQNGNANFSLHLDLPQNDTIEDKFHSLLAKSMKSTDSQANGSLTNNLIEGLNSSNSMNLNYSEATDSLGSIVNGETECSSTITSLPSIQSSHSTPIGKSTAEPHQEPKPTKPVPISFSIKKPKEEKLDIPSALPVEESDSEGGEETEVKVKQEQHSSDNIKNTSSSDVTTEIIPLPLIPKNVRKEIKEEAKALKKAKEQSKISGGAKKKRGETRTISSAASHYGKSSSSTKDIKTENKTQIKMDLDDDFPPGLNIATKKTSDLKKMEERRRRAAEFKKKMAAATQIKEIPEDAPDVKMVKPDPDITEHIIPELEIIDTQISTTTEVTPDGDLIYTETVMLMNENDNSPRPEPTNAPYARSGFSIDEPYARPGPLNDFDMGAIEPTVLPEYGNIVVSRAIFLPPSNLNASEEDVSAPSIEIASLDDSLSRPNRELSSSPFGDSSIHTIGIEISSEDDRDVENQAVVESQVNENPPVALNVELTNDNGMVSHGTGAAAAACPWNFSESSLVFSSAQASSANGTKPASTKPVKIPDSHVHDVKIEISSDSETSFEKTKRLKRKRKAEKKSKTRKSKKKKSKHVHRPALQELLTSDSSSSESEDYDSSSTSSSSEEERRRREKRRRKEKKRKALKRAHKKRSHRRRRPADSSSSD